MGVFSYPRHPPRPSSIAVKYGLFYGFRPLNSPYFTATYEGALEC